MISTILTGERIEFLEAKRVTKHGQLMNVLFSAAILSGAGSADKHRRRGRA
jgi:hypothetical protein